MKAPEIASEAARIVAGDREKQHGDKTINGQCMAYLIEAIEKCRALTDHPYDGRHAFNVMEGIKIARRYSGAHNVDDYVDGAGYASCSGEIAESMKPKPTGEGG